MHGTALGQRLKTFHDGLTTFAEGERVPMPLTATEIRVHILAGLAIVRTVRSFRNVEKMPIEAVMTFPVGFDAVVTELAATIDSRRMLGKAQPKEEARGIYEAALDGGKLSVLHEEVLRGVHVLSVGALPPGASVDVELEQVIPLASAGGIQFLRLPVTVGQLYGASPLLPADDLVTAEEICQRATMHILAECGPVVFEGQHLVAGSSVKLLLDRTIELWIEEPVIGTVSGGSGYARNVELSFQHNDAETEPLDLHVLVDRSGSTGSLTSDAGLSIWQAIRDGLASELASLQDHDTIHLWQFSDDCKHLGTARGSNAVDLVAKLENPDGGTELGLAVQKVVRSGARDILVLTDGQTWAHTVEELKGKGARISAVLVGPGSLDANIGHLCAMTGGQLFYVPGANVAAALHSALLSLRSPSKPVEGYVTKGQPESLMVQRGGVTIRAAWQRANVKANDDQFQAVGRFAAALALPLLSQDKALAWATSHNLCTHMTSLVLVDHDGAAVSGFSRMRKVPVMASFAARHQVTPNHGAMAFLKKAAVPVQSSMPSDSRVASPLHGPPRAAPRNLSVSERPAPVSKDANAIKSIRALWSRLLSGRDQPKKSLTSALFIGFAWDIWGDQLLAGSFGSLSADRRLVLDNLADQLRQVPNSITVPELDRAKLEVWALGLIARQLSERLASRFARRALLDAPEWILAESPS